MSATDGARLLTGARVVTPDGVLDPGWVQVRGGRITQVGQGEPPAGPLAHDLDRAWLLPGFIDLHMHGGGGHDVASSPEAMRAAVAYHRAHGTTRTLVSLVAAPPRELADQLGWIAQLTAEPDAGVHGAHLEGPFLSQAMCGAQNPAYLLRPDRAELDALLTAAAGTMRSVTIAPELPGALDLIRDVVAAGAVAAMGHSDATYAQAQAGIAAGATLATHLFNGMRGLHHREPGLVGAALASGLACEVINDGVHVHPSITHLVASCDDQLVLITDSIALAGAADGSFLLGGQRVRVQDGVARLSSTGSLAGSTLTMDTAVRDAVQRSGLGIEAASAAASGRPARLLGLAGEVGAIAAGLAADLVVLDADLQVAAVMHSGEWAVPVARSSSDLAVGLDQ